MWGPSHTPRFSPGLCVGFPVELQETVNVEKTGMHHLMYANCAGTSTVLITDNTKWLGPHGYLPDNLYPALPFFLCMSLLYSLAIGAWSVVIFDRTHGAPPVQCCIGGVAVVGLLEAIAWYVYLSYANKTGQRAVPLLLTAVLFSTLKKAATRILILVRDFVGLL